MPNFRFGKIAILELMGLSLIPITNVFLVEMDAILVLRPSAVKVAPLAIIWLGLFVKLFLSTNLQVVMFPIASSVQMKELAHRAPINLPSLI